MEPTKKEVREKIQYAKDAIKRLQEDDFWNDDIETKDAMIAGYKKMIEKGTLWIIEKTPCTKGCIECGNKFESFKRFQDICPVCIAKLPEKVKCQTCYDNDIANAVNREEIAFCFQWNDGVKEYECIECHTDFMDQEIAAKHSC